ncbi:hypothetical protein NRB20_58380 [Nocardia sp. RB20]|uniref:Uncharacterized protein n=1 Tax=Nocardia macrotermitis TaxID=2585198 RepID=A0A7K0DAA7_9NOCA|nr:hypothetical protein [Nocardia macrotermitis]
MRVPGLECAGTGRGRVSRASVVCAGVDLADQGVDSELTSRSLEFMQPIESTSAVGVALVSLFHPAVATIRSPAKSRSP